MHSPNLPTVQPMIFSSLLDFLPCLPQEGRLMALDVGTKWVGVALSDPTRTVATPETKVARSPTGACLATLFTYAKTQGVVGVVVGLPLSLEGRMTPMTQATKAFAHLFIKAGYTGPILLWDERFSTAVMERSLIKADVSRQKRARVVDQLAACYLLQGVLESLKS
ncbi:MAG: Holliday junction resolvase RuvX [Alphaproteobacteria bacterium]